MPKKRSDPPPPKKAKAKPVRRPHKKQKSLGVAERRQEVAKLYVRGYYQAEIADSLGVCRTLICKDLAAIQEEWAKENVQNLNAVKVRELEKLDQIEREAWRAWERSQKDEETTKKTNIELRSSDDAGTVHVPADKTEHTLKGQAGDPRFLDQIQKVIERRCRLLGLDAPTKIDGNVNATFLTREQLAEEILSKLDSLPK